MIKSLQRHTINKYKYDIYTDINNLITKLITDDKNELDRLVCVDSNNMITSKTGQKSTSIVQKLKTDIKYFNMTEQNLKDSIEKYIDNYQDLVNAISNVKHDRYKYLFATNSIDEYTDHQYFGNVSLDELDEKQSNVSPDIMECYDAHKKRIYYTENLYNYSNSGDLVKLSKTITYIKNAYIASVDNTNPLMKFSNKIIREETIIDLEKLEELFLEYNLYKDDLKKRSSDNRNFEWALFEKETYEIYGEELLSFYEPYQEIH